MPSLWHFEIANVLLTAERRKRIKIAHTAKITELLKSLPITTYADIGSEFETLNKTIALGRTYKLSAYDASYLELAIRTGYPLATLDKNLQNAAKKTGVELFR